MLYLFNFTIVFGSLLNFWAVSNNVLKPCDVDMGEH